MCLFDNVWHIILQERGNRLFKKGILHNAIIREATHVSLWYYLSDSS